MKNIESVMLILIVIFYEVLQVAITLTENLQSYDLTRENLA